MEKMESFNQAPEINREIPSTLPGLLRVLQEKGRLAEFFQQGSQEVERINAIDDPNQRAEELASLVERFTKE